MMNKYYLYVLSSAVVLLAGCEAQGDYPGLEYAPQMYHSVPYEPLTQITDREDGEWLSSLDDNVGEFYNSNPNNAYAMNVRIPAANTIRRNTDHYSAGGHFETNPELVLPYKIPADSLEYASRVLKNPLEATDDVVGQGQVLYATFCYPCHGGNGLGDGPVGKVYKGVPAFNAGRYKEMTEGHIFHVITYGQGRMNPYASQVSIEDRWKIVEYVQTLQNQ